VKPKLVAGVILSLMSTAAAAQLPFPPNWLNAPVGIAKQNVYPYPGQCWTAAPIGDLPQCQITNAAAPGYAPSFICPTGGGTNQSAFSAACGAVTAAPLVNPVLPETQLKFQWEVLNPPDYTPDTTTFPGVEYYEVGLHEAQGFQALAAAGLFPNPLLAGGTAVPEGKQWTGLVDPVTRAPLFTPIWGVGQINQPAAGTVTSTLTGLGLFTGGTPTAWSANSYVATWPSISIRGKTGLPVRVKWVNEFPNTHLFCPHPEAADWPCAIDRTFMGVKATIDPQKTVTLNTQNGVVPYKVNQYGSPQQPDNSWVTHLHGGEIQPSVDGFAEKWFGNKVTGAVYSPIPWPLDPVFKAPYEAIEKGNIQPVLFRPGGPDAPGATSSYYYDTYTYPMVNQESTIWFHDHTLGKTHHNVIAGPAGFFPVKDPAKHNAIVNGVCQIPGNPLACEYTWLDPITEPKDALGIPLYDLFLAVQDRTFSDDGTINFSNGLGQPLIAPPAVPGDPAYPACLAAGTCTAPGSTPWSNGVNPQVHPVWVPEYLGDHAVVNGVLWPKKTVAPGWYRVRMVDGSDTRCWTLSFQTAEPVYATLASPGSRVIRNVRFDVIANEQGYLPVALRNQQQFTMCPGERYEIMINFGGAHAAYNDPVTNARVPAGPLAGKSVWMVNSAGAPYPAGVTPQVAGSPFAQLASVMRFDVTTAAAAPVPPVLTCPVGQGATWPGDAVNPARSCVAFPPVIDQGFVNITGLLDCPKDAAGKPITTLGPCVAAERQLFLNEQVDATTGFPLGMQINGVPFEYDVTETPQIGTYERWKIINLTVDAHPIHPHLIKAQIVSRQNFRRGAYKTVLCGSTVCDPAPAVGGMMLLVPDVTPYLSGAPVLPAAFESGWKDAMVSLPNQVLTFNALWDGAWAGAKGECVPDDVSCFEAVTAGPYVWHCHINSHEDSEMMRTSLVVK
jgi:FtsP/CotA-like multicopper oxidase with cupredoxin domain